MKIPVMLVGGPYDGRIISVDAYQGKPVDGVIRFPVFESGRKLTADDFVDWAGDSVSEAGQIVYELDPKYRSDTIHNFEYKYQGC